MIICASGIQAQKIKEIQPDEKYPKNHLNYTPLQTSNSSMDQLKALNFGCYPPSVNWHDNFGGSAPDYVRSICADSDENIYIAGQFSGETTLGDYSYNSIGDIDGFVAKFNAIGDMIWFDQISSDEGSDIVVYSIITDASDNIYITGKFTGTITIGTEQLVGGEFYSMLFAKYNSSGEVLMAKKLSSSADITGSKIVLADNGDIYIGVKKSWNNSTRVPIILRKYSNTGNLLWELDPSTNYIDFNDFAISGSYIYWTGAIDGNGETAYINESIYFETFETRYQDVFIAKSDMNGDFLWARRADHETELNGGDSWDAYIAADNNGNVFLTGYYRVDLYFGAYSLFSSGAGFVTKVDPSGDVQWLIQTAERGKNPVTDDNGNCYLRYGSTITKISSSGNFLSSVELPSTYAHNITPSGNILLAGNNEELISLSKMNSSFSIEWTEIFDGNSGSAYVLGMVDDNQGNFYTLGKVGHAAEFFGNNLSNGFFISKQKSSGAIEWINQLPDLYTSGGEIGNVICIDTISEHLFITFPIDSDFVLPNDETIIAGDGSILILKYNLEGQFIWAIHENANIDDLSIITDQSGNIILTGIFSNTINISNNDLVSLGEKDGFIAKYSTEGNLMWVKQAGGEGTEYIAITSTYEDDIYFTGEFLSRNITIGNTTNKYHVGDGHIIFSKLNSSGDVEFMKLLGSGENEGNCWPTGIASDINGNIFVKGWHGDSANFDDIILQSPYGNYSYFISKLNNEGKVLWANSIHEHYYGFDYNQFDVDNEGNVYLGAQARDSLHFGNDYAYGPTSFGDLFVAKYTSAGKLDWVQTLQANYYDNSIQSISAYKDNVIIAGDFKNTLQLGEEQIQSLSSHGFIAVLDQNHAPSDILLKNGVFNENNAVGEAIDTINVIDKEGDNDHIITLINDPGYDNSDFTIEGNILKANTEFDYENKSEYTLLIQAEDNCGRITQKEVNFQVNNVNESPEINHLIPDQITREDETYNYTVPDTIFTDPDNEDVLTYSATLSDGSDLPTWLSITSTGSLSGNPTEMDLKSIRVIVEDMGGLTTSDDFVLVVEGYNELTEEEITVDTTSSDNIVTVSISEDVFINMGLGEDITYTASLADGSSLPSYITFDPQTITFTITLNDNKSYREILEDLDLIVTGTDSEGYIATVGFSISEDLLTNLFSYYIEFKIYPNPVRDKLVVEIPRNNENTILEIYSLTGIKIASYQVDSQRIEIDFSAYDEPIYILNITRRNRSKAYRILNQ